jgi:hypothetical protein
MHESDHLDRLVDSSLSSYGDPGADTGTESGLAERILARVSREQRSDRSAPRWHSRFLLWAALPAAACLLLTFLLLKTAGPGTPHQSASLPQAASAKSGSKAPKVADGAHAEELPTAAKHHTHTPPTIAVSKSAAPPKLDVFPLPHPLSPEEQALYAFATQVPEEQRQAVLAAQKNDDAPLNVAALHIQPLEITDTGKN